MEKHLAKLFFDAVDKNPDKNAIWCENEAITYGELDKMVSKYGKILLDNGVEYGSHIGIPMNNSIESVAIMLTALALGLTLVPINPTLPINAIKTAFNYGNVKHIIARKEFYELSGMDFGISGKMFSIEKSIDGAIALQSGDNIKADRPDCCNLTGNESFIITMTSGSTGKPKPIDLTQDNKYKRAMTHIKMYGLSERDNILAATPLYHSLAERLVIMPLILGAKCTLLQHFTPSNWLNCVNEQNVTFTIAVSAQLAQVAELLTSPFVPEITSLRCIVSSSALLESHVKNELIAKLKCDFHEMYGTSETSTVTDICFGKEKQKNKSVGKAIPGADVHIIDNDSNVLRPGVIGEIACKTDLLCNAYYGQEDMFRKALTDDGYFKTGDLGKIDEDGYLYFMGRKKELIITGGINVYPVDVEECILNLKEVEECAAFSYPDERLGEIVAVAVVPKEGIDLKKRTIRIQCAKNLADFQQPHKIFIVDKLPKNSMGKVIKGKIYESLLKFDGQNVSEGE